jgi:hypothetical protein
MARLKFSLKYSADFPFSFLLERHSIGEEGWSCSQWRYRHLNEAKCAIGLLGGAYDRKYVKTAFTAGCLD